MILPGSRDPFWVRSEDQRLREILAAGGSSAEAAAELSRSENAVTNRARRLGLSLKKTMRAITLAQRAEESAAMAIGQQVEASAPADKRASRKRRLLKGPSSFPDVRKDHSK